MRLMTLVAAGAMAAAIGCGDDNNNNATGGTGGTGTGATAACQQTVVAEKQVTLNDRTMTVVPFTTTSAGRVDVTVQWTTAGNRVAAFIAPTGACNQSQFSGGTCTFTGRSAGTGGDTGSSAAFTGSNPGRFATQNVAAGKYDLILMSYGTADKGGAGATDEAVAVQVVSSVGSGCAAFPSS